MRRDEELALVREEHLAEELQQRRLAGARAAADADHGPLLQLLGGDLGLAKLEALALAQALHEDHGGALVRRLGDGLLGREDDLLDAIELKQRLAHGACPGHLPAQHLQLRARRRQDRLLLKLAEAHALEPGAQRQRPERALARRQPSGRRARALPLDERPAARAVPAAQPAGRRDERRRHVREDRRIRDNAYRNGRQAERRRDRYEDRNIRRDGYRDGYREARRDQRQSRYYDGRRWHDYNRWDSRGWRNNNRYDWQRYRHSNRNVYRLGRYYSPYRDYRYRRLSIGFQLGSLFFGSRYQINDPWRYRLPAVYGPYRWVRYYDDVMLVDIYSGEVVDVIYDFFW